MKGYRINFSIGFCVTVPRSKRPKMRAIQRRLEIAATALLDAQDVTADEHHLADLTDAVESMVSIVRRAKAVNSQK